MKYGATVLRGCLARVCRDGIAGTPFELAQLYTLTYPTSSLDMLAGDIAAREDGTQATLLWCPTVFTKEASTVNP